MRAQPAAFARYSQLVNPVTAAMRIESAVLYGLTAALFGEITIKQGPVEQGNFDTYPIARMADAPVIETHFVLSGGDKWAASANPARRRSRRRSPTQFSPSQASASTRCS
jgi:hypothetical protein